MNDANVILVDSHDKEVGVEEKIRAHTGSGMLHRAVSVLVFRISKGHAETLLQKRSSTKLLWPGLWTNAVCTHPGNGESYKEAGTRRLNEEMGIRTSSDSLVYGFQFEYQAQFSPEFAERELDTVLFLSWDGIFKPNPKEADDSRWITWEGLLKEIQQYKTTYTPWFQQIAADKKTTAYIKTL